jgi:hypothetical protein
MARDPEIDRPPYPQPRSAEAGKPDKQDPIGDSGGYDENLDPAEVDRVYWSACLEDAERAERPWRERGREIIEIYRNESRNTRTGRLTAGPVTFNILFANTEVMLPAAYQKPPTPVVRSRFTQVSEPMLPPPPMALPGLAGGAAPLPPGAPPGLLPPDVPPGGPLPPPGAPGTPPLGDVPVPGGEPLSPPPPGMPIPGPGLPPEVAPPGMPPGAPPLPPGPPMPAAAGAPPGVPGLPLPPPMGHEPAPTRPPQPIIDTAASVIQKVLEILVEDDQSDESVKMAVKDVLLPGRGCARVRWKPQMETQPVEDPVMGGPLSLPGEPPPLEGEEPLTEEVKVWEEVNTEYVFWEDLLCDPVRQAADMNWISFRHLFTKEQLEAEFGDSEQYLKLKSLNRLGELFKWTEESAAKAPVGGGSAMKTSRALGDHVKKCMVWEVWDRTKRRIIWFVREAAGVVLRVDDDSLQLTGFYPIPQPMLAIRTTDSRIPRAYYDIYSKLAGDLDEVSQRISQLTKMIKVRGAYNSASNDIADILTAGDGKMLPVDGVDLINGGLANHIWLVPIEMWMTALDKLLLAKEQLKQSIYEIMGISDIMRGATRASETATAQRIKGSMGMSRLEDFKQTCGNFVRDLLRLQAEIVCQQFDAKTLELMTGEKVTDEVMSILRSDFMRTCTIDIETDSTVVPDQQAEQEGMAQIMQTVGMVMQGAQGMLMTGILPPPMVMNLSLEMIKMALHPVRYSRGVVEMINDFQEQLAQQQAIQAMMPPAPPPPPGPPPPQAGPVAKGNGAAPSSGGPPGPPPGGPPPPPSNGAGPPPLQ